MDNVQYKMWLRRNKRLYAPIDKLRRNQKQVERVHNKNKGKPLKYLKNGFLPEQQWGALRNSWQGYRISRGHMDDRLAQWYAAGIQRFANELHLRIPDFPEVQMLALSFYEDNAEFLKEEMSPQEVFEKMLEKDFEYLREKVENE
jgi:hypothetical protein